MLYAGALSATGKIYNDLSIKYWIEDGMKKCEIKELQGYTLNTKILYIS